MTQAVKNVPFWIYGLYLLLTITNVSSAELELTASEIEFIKNHPIITLGTDKSWEPYVITSDNGIISGYDSEILNKINQITGANFQLTLGNWSEMQEAAKARRIDGLSTGAAIPERLSYLNFSFPYLTLQKSVFVALGNPAQIQDAQSLIDKTVVIQKGNLSDIELVKQFDGVKVLFVDTVTELLSAVSSGRADATFGNGATLYLANKLGMPYLQTAFHLDQKLDLVMGVRNDWPEAISILNKGLTAIPQHEKIAIQTRWFSLSAPENNNAEPEGNIKLSKGEQKLLKELGQFTLCAEEEWAPFISFTRKKHSGIISDVLTLIGEKLGTEIQLNNSGNWHQTLEALKTGQCDAVVPIAQTQARKKFLDFSNPIFTSPIVLVTRQDQLFVPDIAKLKDNPISVIRSSAVHDLLKQNYPDMNIQTTDSISEALKDVTQEKLFGYIDSYEAIAHHINSGQFVSLKVSSTLPMNYPLSVGFQKGMRQYIPLFNKAIYSVTKEEFTAITNRWVGVRYDKPVNYWMFFWAVVGGLILMGLLIYRNRVISSYNSKLMNLNELLAKQATTDHLTGLSNRYLINQEMEKAIASASRYETPLALILFDLDLFKQINDQFGHQAGDAVLQEVSQLLISESRQADTLGRWGGEEFIMLCPHTDLNGAKLIANKICESTKAKKYSVDFPITFSAGATVYIQGESHHELIKRVDDALYQAKNSGRDKIVSL
ncbi:diguanylate cyclase domain-containing protein [Neptuniibacter caesariensis]|uniref:diguanylate cyclase n=1 Tax=Neptuniibacter caesariensis TaxID=207954 RepID=A0A7U8C9F3_NEPCE|nr:transporter substrate-binding domain-containing protein [Neptuniibacter caesariensis]EAR63016.1 diguanylate cyclase (GGDEF domain) [Oceanospirillum sp. MED92] [Neptuniibacter caesariensis]